MRLKSVVTGLFYFSLPLLAGEAASQQVSLVLPAGVPLRLYLTKRVPKRVGATVEAKLLDPVYAFDRQVVPAGTVVLGRIVRVKPVPKSERVRAIMGGDFTPLHTAPIEFNTLVMPDGRSLSVKTLESLGLNSMVSSRPAKKQRANAPPNGGVLGTGKQQVHDAIQAQIDRARSIPDLVRGPDKKEKVEDYLMTKLPYHPQYVRKGMRFDADLTEPLDFGAERVLPASLAPPGTQPPPGSVAEARLITSVDSKSSKQGDKVEAALTAPVFSPDHRLILPEGTRLEGTVVTARPARWFHRGGQLRFSFKEIELPEETARLQATAAVSPITGARPAQEQVEVPDRG